jgi:threonine dehydratase
MSLSPLEKAPSSLVEDREVYLKREDLHELGSFKWRGALPTLEEFRRKGTETVVTASTGNHGAATAWAAERLGMRAIVYASEEASRTKVELMESLGADLRLVGADFDEAKEHAVRAAAEAGVLFVDGLERAQYEGYGAIAGEILQELDSPAAMVVPVGNGALLGGIGLVVCERNPDTLRIGVAAKEAPVMARSWEEGRVVEDDRCATFADGLAVRVAVPLAVEVLGEVASRFLLVSEREIAQGVAAFADAGIRAEGAAGAALAALPHLDDVEGSIVLVVTGRNIDEDVFRRARERPESFPD